jgi:hypothetical protein
MEENIDFCIIVERKNNKKIKINEKIVIFRIQIHCKKYEVDILE